MAIFGRSISPPPPPPTVENSIIKGLEQRPVGEQPYLPNHNGSVELVRAYVTLGFRTINTIQPQDVDKIVTRYLNGDDMSKIAKEEAQRIRNEFRQQGGQGTKSISLHHTGTPPAKYVPTGPLVGEEDNPTQSYRPAPRDVNIPDGFEMRDGLYVPIREPLTIAEMEEKVRRLDVRAHNLNQVFVTMALIFLAGNISTIVTEFNFTGIVLLPFFLLTLWGRHHSHMQYNKARRELEDMKVNQVLGRDEFRGRGTTTVMR